MTVQVNDPRALVPLLEQSLASFNSSQSSFAAAEIIKAGLQWPVPGYWADRALGWIEQGHAIDREIRLELQRVSKDKSHSQSARHRAIALLNRSIET